MPRVLLTAPLAFVITFALFLGMRALIQESELDLSQPRTEPLPPFTLVRPDLEPLAKDRRKPERLDAPHTPKIDRARNPDSPNVSVSSMDTEGLAIGDFAIEQRGGPGADLVIVDGDAAPLVRVHPLYPRIAAMKGVEGHVTVKFCVSINGTVVDPQVIDASPRGIFENAARSAVAKWKYRPRIVGGAPVRRCVPPVRIDFVL